MAAVTAVLFLLAASLGCNGDGASPAGPDSTAAPPPPTAPPPAAFIVTAYSPHEGPATGGTELTVWGTGFREGTVVTFGGVPATSVHVYHSSLLTAVAPPHDAGVVDVVALDPDGRSATLPQSFRYLPVDPGNPDSCAGCWDY